MQRLRRMVPLSYGRGTAMGKALMLVLALCAAPVRADEVVIAALGDSLVQGYGLPAQQGFVPQLQGWLEDRGHNVRLINAGVSGDTTAGGLARVGWTLTDDVDAMIVALGGNDLLRGLPPEDARANLAGILQATEAQGVEVLLVGLQAPLNYGADYKQAFDAIYPELAEEYGALHAENFLQPIMEAEDPTALMQGDGIHPNAAGVAAVVEALGPRVATLVARVMPVD